MHVFSFSQLNVFANTPFGIRVSLGNPRLEIKWINEPKPLKLAFYE